MIKTTKVARHRRQRIRDFILYVVIALTVVAVVAAIAATGLTGNTFIKWLGLIAFTSLLFGYFIADSRSLWKRPKFWIMSGICLLLHLRGFVFLFAHMATFKPIWFGMIGLAEMLLLIFLKEYLMKENTMGCPK